MNWTGSTAIALASAVAFGCNRAPDDLREWRPSDHTGEAPPTAGAPTQVSGSAEPALPGLEEVTIVTWQRQCTQCHGAVGRGDGPKGAMVKARDLSDPAWQTSATDAQIAEAIVKGKNAMPAFMLPPSTVDGLVHLVRLLDRNRKVAGPTAGGSDAKQSRAAERQPAPTASNNK
jgi:cytochrome c oxidase cbb3-type subunit 3